MAAGNGKRHSFLGLGIVVGDRAGFRVMRDDRHIEYEAGARTDGEERRIARRALLAQRRQHDRHHLVEPLQHAKQRGVETAGRVVVGGRGKLVVEAERVEERAQPRIVVRAEAIVRAERIGHAGQRLTEIGFEQVLVRDVVGHLAQAVHVVGERKQPRLDLVVGQHAESVAHHRGARDLAEGADMRQPRRTIAGLEQHFVLRFLLQPRDNRLRLLERPGIGLFGERTQVARACGKIDRGHLRKSFSEDTRMVRRL